MLDTRPFTRAERAQGRSLCSASQPSVSALSRWSPVPRKNRHAEFFEGRSFDGLPSREATPAEANPLSDRERHSDAGKMGLPASVVRPPRQARAGSVYRHTDARLNRLGFARTNASGHSSEGMDYLLASRASI